MHQDRTVCLSDPALWNRRMGCSKVMDIKKTSAIQNRCIIPRMFTPKLKRQEKNNKGMNFSIHRVPQTVPSPCAHLLYDSSMSLSLRLTIEQRRSIRLAFHELDHDGATVDINGAAVELRSQKSHLLSPRMILPIAGLLAGLLSTRIELRAQQPIPQGQPCTALSLGWRSDRGCHPSRSVHRSQAHVTGARNISGYTSKTLENLSPEEEYALYQHFPWTVKRKKKTIGQRKPSMRTTL